MSQEIDTVENRIEHLVRSRKTEAARKQIQRWLRQKRNTLSARIQACDWLKRLGLNREAYRLIAPKEWKFSEALKNPLYRTSLIWAARLLNLMGAPRYSLQILHQIPNPDPELLLTLGNLHLSQYQCEEAFLSYQRYFQKLDSTQQTSYTSRLTRVSFADSLNGIGKTAEALEMLRQIRTQADEALLKGIIHQARGEYFTHLKNWKQANEELQKAQTLIPIEDESSDRAFLTKWLAYTEAHLETGSPQALMHFEQVLKRLQKPDQKPETWLDCFALMKKTNLLKSGDETTLYTYPGVPEEFYALRCERPSFPIWIGEKDAPYVLYPAREEYRTKKGSHLGYPKEIELLELIRRAATHGLSLERAKSLLWPDEFAAFLQLDSRIAQLIKRLRTHWGFKITVDEHTIFGDRKLLESVAIEYCGETPLKLPPTFLLSHSEFSTKMLAQAYKMKKTTLFKAISRFEKSGWIKKQVKKRQVSYLVLDQIITQYL